MDALPPAYRLDHPRPDLGSLLALIAVMVDERRSAVLHVTAARHGEGTTTVAREMAAAAATAPWCRVALIDAGRDSAAPVLLPSLLGTLERARTPVLRQGRIGGAPVALAQLSSPGEPAPSMDAVRDAFAWLQTQYALVVVDSPPVLPSRQSAVLASVADGTLLVVEAERTRLADMRQAREILQQLGTPVLGVVLNRRRRRVPRFLAARL